MRTGPLSSSSTGHLTPLRSEDEDTGTEGMYSEDEREPSSGDEILGKYREEVSQLREELRTVREELERTRQEKEQTGTEVRGRPSSSQSFPPLSSSSSYQASHEIISRSDYGILLSSESEDEADDERSKGKARRRRQKGREQKKRKLKRQKEESSTDAASKGEGRPPDEPQHPPTSIAAPPALSLSYSFSQAAFSLFTKLKRTI